MTSSTSYRIGIDVTSALTQGGGIGRYTRELVHAISEQDSHNQYQLFSAKLVAEPPVDNPLPFCDNFAYKAGPLNERWLYRLWYRARFPLPVQVISGRLDLFHSPDFVLPPVAGNIPTLLTVHDLSFVHFADVYVPSLVSYLNKVVPWSVKRATHILADSEATKRDLISIYGVSAEKITTLYAGVSPHFRPITNAQSLQTMRQKYDLGDAPYLLSVGTVQPRKNYRMLIRAFAPIAKRFPHNLAIAGGKGWLFDDILAEIEAQGLTGRVKFLGFVDDEDLPTLYSGATLFAMPSIYEGFGIPILEAMACNIPVVASNASCLPEVVADAGVLLDPDEQQAWTDAIVDLLENPAQGERLAVLGAEQGRKFTWGKSAEQLIKLYHQLIERQ
ncbi:MAG: glycosyltransferase family 4 protein [Candidatus Promineifilaceae bacterium]